MGNAPGKYPVRTGIYPRVFEQDASHGLSPNETTLADCLRAEGYATKIVGKWHLGQRPQYLPTERGFDEWFGIPYHMSGGSLEDHICEGKDNHTGKLWLPLFDGTSIIEQPVVPENLAPRYVNESISFFERSIEEDRPFFLYLAFSHVHQLCAPRQSECQWASTHFSRNKTGYNATFADALEEMDWIAGQVLQGLSDLGIEENTLVIFTSDNGPWVAEGSCAGSKGPFRGRWLAENVEASCTACPSEYVPAPLPGRPRRCVFPDPNSQTLGTNENDRGRTETVYETEGIHCGEDSGLGSAWEANVRMPAFAKWPGGKIPRGSKTMEMVTTLDVLPTILGMLGIEQQLPSGIDGIDVSDVILGRDARETTTGSSDPATDDDTSRIAKNDRPIFFWRDGFASGPLPQPFGRFDVVAMKVGWIKAWFYTKSSHYNADAEVFHDPPLLFDVEQDPSESTPLDPRQYSSWIATAKRLLKQHKDSVDWTAPLCLDRDRRYLPCVDEATNCRTRKPPAASIEGHQTAEASASTSMDEMSTSEA